MNTWKPPEERAPNRLRLADTGVLWDGQTDGTPHDYLKQIAMKWGVGIEPVPVVILRREDFVQLLEELERRSLYLGCA